MTRKCLISCATYMIFSAICLVSMYLMLLADVNKYVGVGIGSGILVAFFVMYMFLRKPLCKLRKPLLTAFIFLPASAIGCGLAISSLYVYLGVAPDIIYSFCIWTAYAVLFLIYCFLVKIPFFKRFPRICLAVYGLLTLAGGIVGMCLSSTTVFSLALMTFIVFISYLSTILARSKDYGEHNNTLVLVSFIGLLIIVIVVFIVISQGEGLDGIDGGGVAPDGGDYKRTKRNPYDFMESANTMKWTNIK